MPDLDLEERLRWICTRPSATAPASGTGGTTSRVDSARRWRGAAVASG